MKTTNRLLTAAEAADRLHVDRQTVWKWGRTGRLPVVRFGLRCVRFKPEDVERLIEEARQ